MNTAARLVRQNILSRYFVSFYLLSRQQMTVFILILSILISALSIIYVTHISRLLHGEYMHALSEQHHIYMRMNQLLLERSIWMTQTRIQEIAEKELKMHIPDPKSMIVIHE